MVSKSSTTPTFSWTETNAANAPITYHIQRREQYYQGYWTAYHALITSSNATLTDTGLNANSTYAYEVMATNATGSSAYSAEMPFVTGPAAPQYLTAYVVSSTAVQLYWSPVTGAVSYTLMRQTGSGAAVDAGDFPATTTTNTTDTGLTPFTTYTYTVVAHNANGDSDPSPPCNATTKPAPPSDVNATAISSSEIDLSWNDTSGGRASFIILRGYGTGGTNFTQIGTTAAGVSTYQDTNLTPNVTYSYEIEAVNGSGDSDPSTPASATTWPGAPTGLTASAVSSTEIDLTWDASNSEYGAALTYTVQQQNSDGTWTTRGTPGTNSFHDTGLTANTQYTYQVIANNGGYSDPSDAAGATTYPAAPDGLQATAGVNQVALQWNPTDGAASYNVKRSTTQGGPYTIVQSGGVVTSTTFIDNSVTGGTTYYYVVTAIPDDGILYNDESPNSNEASATPTSGSVVIKVSRKGANHFDTSAIIAAGAVDSDNDHHADVLITVTPPQSGLSVFPQVIGGDASELGPEGVATLQMDSSVTDVNGKITGIYRSSNVRTDVTIQVGNGGGGTSSATIHQHWDDLIVPPRTDTTDWNYGDTFTEDQPFEVDFLPVFLDALGQRLGIKSHQIELYPTSMTVEFWNASLGTNGDWDSGTFDASELPDLADFDSVPAVEGPAGTYKANLIVHSDPDYIVDEIEFNAMDLGVFAP